jgi:hypothetical protein
MFDGHDRVAGGDHSVNHISAREMPRIPEGWVNTHCQDKYQIEIVENPLARQTAPRCVSQRCHSGHAVQSSLAS